MKKLFHFSFFAKKKGANRHIVTDKKEATKTQESRVPKNNNATTDPVSATPAAAGKNTKLKKSKNSFLSFFQKSKTEKKPPAPQESVQIPEAQNIPRGCWPFKFFRTKHKITPISPISTALGKISLNTPTSSINYKPTEEHLLKLFSSSSSSDQNMTSPDTKPSSSSDETTEEETLQDVTFSVSEKLLKMTALGLSGSEEVITEEIDVGGLSTSSSDEDETTEDTDAIDVLQKLIQLKEYPELIETLLLNPLLFSKYKRDIQTPYENILNRNIANPQGFPNIGNTCYMNSTLQSLLCLEDFFRSIICTKQVWSLVPEAQLLSKLAEIGDCHTSTDSKLKTSLLKSFKKVVSDLAPDFSSNLQKDAHEFLITVLSQIQFLAPQLQKTASYLGTKYTCPVEENLVFRMENTRTCKMCEDQSLRQEKFTNLSLDLVPGGSVEEMLEKYLMEVELEFNCECGGKMSGQKSAFATLPRFLVIHLKRFRFTPSVNLEKVNDPVRLQRELVVSSKLGGGCYSLISAISHFGNTERGHYICDGVHPENRPDGPTDLWLTFNDSEVGETTGWKVCKERQESAYVLFYRRHV